MTENSARAASRTAPRFPAPAQGQLTEEMKQSFNDNGVLVLENFVSREVCEQLMQRAGEIVEAFDPDEFRAVFSTTQKSHEGNSYFEQSGDKIRCFFEEEAFDEQGNLKQSKALSINKIGHAQHDLDPVFSAFSRNPALAQIAANLGMAQPLLSQSMYIFKQPRIGGEVVCHQDSTFLYTEPHSCIGLWFALEDATIENGCMWGLPGHHKAPLKKRHYRNAAGKLVTEKLNDSSWPEEDRVPLDVKQGSLIVLHGQLPHLSGPNRSDKSRQAYTLHLIDGACHYPDSNWLVRSPDLPFRGFETDNA
ncbi:phytanoyl-CoA dioxygenase family protein [Kiloniella laminariae]|uniref:phytanoyl-CoA dioxygenase family protein n=1 Tax=Kiloniella laminariae TaxID=454162 RepID=UPI0003671DD2|nr:phytanoyl-CoA dioxygenase family protein [Kiloniella laminariae]